MKLKFLRLFTALIAFFCISCGFLPQKPEKVEFLQGKGSDSETYTFKATNCKKSFILLGASFCTFCPAEGEALKEEYLARKDSGFCALYISEDSSEKEMELYVAKANYPFPSIFWNYELMNTLGNPPYVPAHFLLDSTGKVLQAGIGAIGKDSLHKLLEKNF